MSGRRKKEIQWRAKFPRTKREDFLQYWGSQRRLQAADAENSKTGLVKYASCDPDQLQPYPFPPITGSVTAISIDQAPRGHNPRWKKEGYFGGEYDTPLAANEESWSEMKTYATDPSFHSRRTGDNGADFSPSRRDTSISSIDSPPLLSISQVGLNGYNYGPVTPYSEKSFGYQPDNDEVFDQSPDPNRSRLYFNNVAQYLSYDPARLDPIREADEYLMRGAVHSQQNEQASDFDILCYVLGILGYLINIGSDIALAIRYFTTGQYIFFALTVFFVALPAFLMTVFSAILYYQDRKIMAKKASALNWMCRIITHSCLLAPFVRLIETLRFGLKSRQDEGWRENRKNYKFMLDEDVDLTLIRLFENFLENAPQLTLQLYIMSAHGTSNDYVLTALQYIGVLTSWISLAWSFVSFATALRNSNPTKAKMKVSGKIGMFLWRFFTIGARMIALALFATAFGFYATLALVGGHLMVMIFWMLMQNSFYCSVELKDEEGNITVKQNSCKEHLFRIMTAFTLIFTFFNIAEGRTRLRSVVYYAIIFGENMAMVLSWYITASTKTHEWYHTPAMIMVVFGFFIGIAFQVMYYKCCHPIYYSKEHENVTIPIWVPCDDLSLVGPVSKKDVEESFTEEQSRVSKGRAPIYRPPSRAGSVGAGSTVDQSSMAGVRRPLEDDALDVNDSLTYRPDSTKRSEVPKVQKREKLREEERDDDSGYRPSPPRNRKEVNNRPTHEPPREEQQPSPTKQRGTPQRGQQTPTKPVPAPRERPPRDRSPAPSSPQRHIVLQQPPPGRSPHMARAAASSPSRSPYNSRRGPASGDRPEDDLSTTESLQDDRKVTTV